MRYYIRHLRQHGDFREYVPPGVTAVIFMESLPVIPPPLFASFLSHCHEAFPLCRDVIMYQNVQGDSSMIKPMTAFFRKVVSIVTSCDFGRVITAKEITDIVESSASNSPSPSSISSFSSSSSSSSSSSGPTEDEDVRRRRRRTNQMTKSAPARAGAERSGDGNGGVSPGEASSWEIDAVLSATPSQFKVWRFARFAGVAALGDPSLLPRLAVIALAALAAAVVAGLCRLFPCVDRRLRMDRHVVRLKLHRKNPSTTTTTIQQNDDPAASSRSRTSPLGWVSLPSKGPLSQRLESLAVARARS